MSDKRPWIEPRPVGDPGRGLAVEIRRGPDAHLAISRDNGGIVFFDLDEARDLCAVIAEAAADLAAELAEGGGD